MVVEDTTSPLHTVEVVLLSQRNTTRGLKIPLELIFPKSTVLSREWVPQTLYRFVCDLDPQRPVRTGARQPASAVSEQPVLCEGAA